MSWIIVEKGFLKEHNRHKWQDIIPNFSRQCITCGEFQILHIGLKRDKDVQYMEGAFPIRP